MEKVHYSVSSSTTLWHWQPDLFTSHWFHNQVPWLWVSVFCFFCLVFLSCRHSSSRLQLKPCVVEKQASVCGEIACLEWEGACRLQRSQSKHTNSSWPSHTTCWRMHLNSQSGIPPRPPSLPPHLNMKVYVDPVLQAQSAIFKCIVLQLLCDALKNNEDQVKATGKDSCWAFDLVSGV